jgi:predicted site-specific integrase-resolvase
MANELQATTTENGDDGFLSADELLKKLPVSRGTLHNYVKQGVIPCVRLGGRRILFHWPSVQESLLRRQRQVAA